MRTNQCQTCGKVVPINDSFTAFGRVLCGECAQANLVEGQYTKESVFRNSDPTVCSQCSRDYGQKELLTVAGLPACPGCRSKFINRPFPMWVKLSFLAVFALAGVEMSRNYRLFQAYFEIPRAHKAMDDGDMETAQALLASACAHVPEMNVLATEEQFCRGICCLRKGEYAQARSVLQECSAQLPPQERATVEKYIVVCNFQDAVKRKDYTQARLAVSRMDGSANGAKMQAEMRQAIDIGEAFDTKNYDKFLSLSQAMELQAPSDSQCVAQTASALACKYAVTGDEKFKTDSMVRLAKARELSKDSATFKEYEERILHRLKTREIIDREEYDRRFRKADEGTDK